MIGDAGIDDRRAAVEIERGPMNRRNDRDTRAIDVAPPAIDLDGGPSLRERPRILVTWFQDGPARGIDVTYPALQGGGEQRPRRRTPASERGHNETPHAGNEKLSHPTIIERADQTWYAHKTMRSARM